VDGQLDVEGHVPQAAAASQTMRWGHGDLLEVRLPGMVTIVALVVSELPPVGGGRFMRTSLARTSKSVRRFAIIRIPPVRLDTGRLGQILFPASLIKPTIRQESCHEKGI
jgi:hypothetical protein